ncbi:hypothetical protein HZH68_000838 [Vespula germanica]|uniref:Uncharacterized protein n=1 Tax=Vespula germanica TaxID=30212 RepID=A0A834U6E1_VESGE|nr:hypothetical protein HZH68_000838 [Vespula germanica]
MRMGTTVQQNEIVSSQTISSKTRSVEIITYENRSRFFGSERRRPAQKLTSMSLTHETHPTETIIINLTYLLPNLRKI